MTRDTFWPQRTGTGMYRDRVNLVNGGQVHDYVSGTAYRHTGRPIISAFEFACGPQCGRNHFFRIVNYSS
jgi:hypothetical protein